ncbi:Retrovirus-related Pol poly from transposon 412 [Olea europaea subsp. europaea]|uniref:Retrovirus-related Pol poly from transposon 412, partial n=1 Tax=Olea europaea subsp. europaea TaxID=158383 RepID=A0A8S0VMD4_OLEEU|nr:Retrovirus-related Pol poly from transposon 412 [Olea europaea subsp. europaea]
MRGGAVRPVAGGTGVPQPTVGRAHALTPAYARPQATDLAPGATVASADHTPDAAVPLCAMRLSPVRAPQAPPAQYVSYPVPTSGVAAPVGRHQQFYPAQAVSSATSMPPPPPPQAAPRPVWYRRLDRYTGVADYQLYRAQFLQHATLMQWDEPTKGAQLSQLLGDKALEVLRHLPPHMMTDFATLDNALQRRFGVPMDTHVYRAKLRTLSQAANQTLEAFANTVEDAVRGAYPTYSEDQIQRQMIDAFVEGLTDSYLALILVRENHSTLDSVLRSARVLPPQMLSGHPRRAHVRTAETENEGDRPTVSRASVSLPDARMDAMIASLNSVSARVEQLSHEQRQWLSGSNSRQASDKGRDERNSWVRDAECFRCGKKGHLKRDCRVPAHKLRNKDGARGRNSSQGDAPARQATQPARTQGGQSSSKN